MSLDRITLSTFRNHADSRIEGTARFNLLFGENGAGKTNVLEAISLLSPGRGLRRAALGELAANTGEGGFAVSARLDLKDGAAPVQIGTGMSPTRPGRRIVQVNAAETSAMALGEWLSVGWLTPAMDRIFTDSAGARRRFVDRMALALDPGHARNAARYENALRERNRLLAEERAQQASWFVAVEAQLAQTGAALAQGRAALVERLQAALVCFPAQPFARPELRYAAGGPLEAGALADTLQRMRPRELAAGRTLTGPHRDDLEVRMAGKDLPAAACSTGEQKAMLIAMILAHSDLATGTRPRILLLDEVAAHLDPIRRSALFERLRGVGQVWLTGTEPGPFADIAQEAALWRVTGGALERVG